MEKFCSFVSFSPGWPPLEAWHISFGRKYWDKIQNKTEINLVIPAKIRSSAKFNLKSSLVLFNRYFLKCENCHHPNDRIVKLILFNCLLYNFPPSWLLSTSLSSTRALAQFFEFWSRLERRSRREIVIKNLLFIGPPSTTQKPSLFCSRLERIWRRELIRKTLLFISPSPITTQKVSNPSSTRKQM